MIAPNPTRRAAPAIPSRKHWRACHLRRLVCAVLGRVRWTGAAPNDRHPAEAACIVSPTAIRPLPGDRAMRSCDLNAPARLGMHFPFSRWVWLSVWVSFQAVRSEEHTSELQSLMRISYAVFCLQKIKIINYTHSYDTHRP